jgi:diguanylate cyclase (GGDEF)-like protein
MMQSVEQAEAEKSIEQWQEEWAAAMQRCDFDLVLAQAKGAADRYERQGNLLGQATALHYLGQAYRESGRIDESLDTFNACLKLRELLGDQKWVAKTLFQISAALGHRSEHEKGVACLVRARTIAQEIGDRDLEMRAQLNLSNSYNHIGDIATALELLYQCLHYFEEIGNTRVVAKVLLNIANNYNLLEEPEEAIRLAQQGLPIMEEIQDLHDTAKALCVLGTAYVKNGQDEQALEYFRCAVEVGETAGIPYIIAIAQGDIGDVLVRLKRYDEARIALEQAMEINGREGHERAYAEFLQRLGSLYAIPDYSEHCDARALQMLHESEQIFSSIDIPPQIAPVYADLVEIYKRQGKLQEALEYCQRLRETEKRVFNQESDKRIRSLQIRFEVEKARQDAEIAHLRSIELAQALAEAERLRALADERARTDALTGVFNRRYLDERLAEEVERSSRHGRPLSVILLDIDHFKRINDTLGHHAGDKTLQCVAALLQQTCRTGDSIARYGGEEFALLLPETTLVEALALAEQMRACIESEAWNTLFDDFRDGSADHPEAAQKSSLTSVTISLGVSTLSSTIPALPIALLAEADRHLYTAKHTGRNRVVG